MDFEVDRTLRCPKCGAFLYRVQVPKGEPCLWCEECETVFLRRGRREDEPVRER